MTPRFEIPDTARDRLARPPADEFRRAAPRLSSPSWYRQKCEALGRASRADQLAGGEHDVVLGFWHAVWMTIEPPC